MKKFLGSLLGFFFFVAAAQAQVVCNDPSGFLKTFGAIPLGDVLVLGPDCQHVQDGGAGSSVVGLIPTTSAVTITIASPGVVTWNNHGLSVGASIIFSTTGALPTPLTAIPVNSNPIAVYVIPVDANHFSLASSLTNAIAGISINTSGSQSGTQTAIANAVACAGCIGEFIWNTIPISGVAIVTTVDKLWNTIQIPPGTWSVGAQSGVFGGAGAVFTAMTSAYGDGISVNVSAPAGGRMTALNITSNNSNGWIFPNPETLFYNTTTSTTNAVLSAVFSGGTAVAYGTLFAKRIH